MEVTTSFWTAIDTLVASASVIIDRPADSRHPRLTDCVYPLDYGYLDGTRAGDGAGIDIWCGSIPERDVTAVLFTVDLMKRDMEAKILLGCTSAEIALITAFHTVGDQSAVALVR